MWNELISDDESKVISLKINSEIARPLFKKKRKNVSAKCSRLNSIIEDDSENEITSYSNSESNDFVSSHITPTLL